MNKAAVQYFQLVYFYRLVLFRYLVLFNLVSLLAENEAEEEPSLDENENLQEPRIEETDFFEKSRIALTFTGKELDEETGYYYFGARYYDPKISSWISTDPALPQYIPTGAQLFFPKEAFHADSLKGAGGIYNSKNINIFHYASLNPIKMVDPDGKASIYSSGNYNFYQADTKFDKILEATISFVPGGSLLSSVMSKVVGITRMGSSQLNLAVNTGLDILGKLDKLGAEGNLAKGVAKGAGLLGMALNAAGMYSALTGDTSKVEAAVQELGLVKGNGDKNFFRAITPFVEGEVGKLIQSGDISVSFDSLGFTKGFGMTEKGEKAVTDLQNKIDSMKEAWDAGNQ